MHVAEEKGIVIDEIELVPVETNILDGAHPRNSVETIASMKALVPEQSIEEKNNANTDNSTVSECVDHHPNSLFWSADEFGDWVKETWALLEASANQGVSGEEILAQRWTTAMPHVPPKEVEFLYDRIVVPLLDAADVLVDEYFLRQNEKDKMYTTFFSKSTNELRDAVPFRHSVQQMKTGIY